MGFGVEEESCVYFVSACYFVRIRCGIRLGFGSFWISDVRRHWGWTGNAGSHGMSESLSNGNYYKTKPLINQRSKPKFPN